jgi:hypothetical protein
MSWISSPGIVLENPHYWASLKQLERVAAAMGKKLVISFEPNQK